MVYRPVVLIVPGLNVLPAGAVTFHVTALPVMLEPVTAAVNCSCPPMIAAAGLGVTVVEVGVGVGAGVGEGLDEPPPPPHAVRKKDRLVAREILAAFLSLMKCMPRAQPRLLLFFYKCFKGLSQARIVGSRNILLRAGHS